MKKQVFSFDKSYIETFARGINSSYTQNAYQIMLSVLDEAMQNICALRPVVTDYECQIINECLNNAETQNSSLDIFMSIKSPQLELGTIKFNHSYFKKFVNRLKLAWNSANQNKQKKRWWKKKKQEQNQKTTNDIRPAKYNFQTFKRELMQELAKRFTDRTMLYISNYGIVLLCNEDLGMNVNLFIGFSNGEKFTLFDEIKLKLIYVEFKDREKNLENKKVRTNNNFVVALRIFNGLYRNIYLKPLNQILLESVLYNCPDELFEDQPYDMFIKLLNFINASAMQTFNSITDEQKTINQDNLITQSAIYDFVTFLKYLAKFL